MKFNQISPLESDFTEVLETIALKPIMLYYYGKMPEQVGFIAYPGDKPDPERLMRPKTVAIVGTRKETSYGHEIAYNAAKACAEAGVVVISGLAYGIDSVAHQAALDAGGKTIAVLGTPINRIYPSSHTKLAEEIIASGGAVISEYGVSGEGGFGEAGGCRFLARNRLIAGLADAVLVVEAAARSGSLNTASHAIEQGKEVMAVPGSINSPLSEGCNNLIASGALVYRKEEDLLEALFPGYIAKNRSKKRKMATFVGTKLERAVYEQILQGVRDGAEVVRNTGITPAEFNQTISLLEIRGRVQSLGGNQWMAI